MIRDEEIRDVATKLLNGEVCEIDGLTVKLEKDAWGEFVCSSCAAPCTNYDDFTLICLECDDMEEGKHYFVDVLGD